MPAVSPPDQALIEHRFAPRNACAELFSCRDAEVLVAGPAGTGKSRACLEKLHIMMLLNPGARGLIARKAAVTLSSTALVTWRRFVAREAIECGDVVYYGGSAQEPASYQYKNGSVVAIGGLDKVSKIMSAEYDCLVGETEVSSLSDIQRAYGRPYSGKLVTITTAGEHKLTGTPNHPVLTNHGWVGLGSLHEGDYVVSRVGQQQERSGAYPHIADKPAAIADVARALALVNPGGAKRVVTVPMDFHGDGSDSYVDIVSTAGLLHDASESSLLEHSSELHGGRRDLEKLALMRDGAPVERGEASWLSLLSAPAMAELAHSLPVGLAATPDLCGALPAFGQLALPRNVGAQSSLPVGKRVGRSFPLDSSGEHLLLEPSDTDVNTGGSITEPSFLSGEIALDRVVDISVADAGPGRHVYNLQTDSNWYFANSIVSHNCIYIQEATELTENDWESLTTRLRNWVISFQQLIADCNPQHPEHWLKQRCDKGITTMLESKHEDNPLLFGADGAVTPNGVEYIGKLDSLTGVRYKRLRLGKWAAAEGVIYETWSNDHLLNAVPHNSGDHVDRAGIPMEWPRYWSVDFGYTNPFVCQMWAEDPDGRLYLYRELYHTQRTVDQHVATIRSLVMNTQGGWLEPRPRSIICDHDAEGRATLENELGLSTEAAHKSVLEGIETVQVRLRPAGDGRPRLYILRGALHERDQELADASKPTCTAEELPAYVWSDKKKESPVKEDDHGCDALRYVCAQREFGVRPIFRSFQV